MKSGAARKRMQGSAWKVWQAGATKPSRMAIGAGKAVHKYCTISGYKPDPPALPSLSERIILLKERQEIKQQLGETREAS